MSKHSFKSWLLATRPWSFPASTMPVLVTLAYLHWMGVSVNWPMGLWAIANIIVFHAAGNTLSDYFDYIKGVDSDETIGGISLTSGEFQPKEIRTLSLALLVFASVSGFAIVATTGLPTLYIGASGFLLTVLYPWLKYHALGDVDIFLTYSLLPILGTSYVATGDFHLQALWLSVPIGLITVGILHANNARDIEHDRRANIKTFAMLIGEKASATVYCAEVIIPFIWIIGGCATGIFPWWALLVLPALKPAIDNARKAMRFPKEGAEQLWGVDEMTAKLQLMFSLLLTLSLFIATYAQ